MIPILTFLLKVPYRTAAWTNLVVFLPTAVVSLVVHVKNRMVDVRAVGRLLPIALIGLFAGVFLVDRVSERAMRFGFGVFLIIVGFCSIFCVLFGYFKRKAKK